MNESNVDPKELAKFAPLANAWWDKEGPLRTLHHINPARVAFVEQYTSLKQKRLLDVGCGGGILSEALAYKGAQVTGIDLEPHAIDTAKAHALNAHLAIDYQCIDIQALNADLFDVITCMDMLEHVPQPELIIKECARLLKPGGYLLLSTLNRTLKAYIGAILLAEYALQLLPKQTHEYQKFIQPAELAHATRAAGLEVIDIQGLTYQPLRKNACLSKNVSINYLMACQKPK